MTFPIPQWYLDYQAAWKEIMSDISNSYEGIKHADICKKCSGEGQLWLEDPSGQAGQWQPCAACNATGLAAGVRPTMTQP